MTFQYDQSRVLESYYTTALLLLQAGYRFQVTENETVPPWVELAHRDLQRITGTNERHDGEPVFDKLAPEVLMSMAKDWQQLQRQFPILGWRYEDNRFNVFAYKVMDYLPPKDINNAFKIADDQLWAFTSKYPVTIGQQMKLMVNFCLGYAHDPSRQAADSTIPKRTHYQPIKGHFSTVWFWDLNTNQLILPSDFLGKTKQATDQFVQQVRKAFEKQQHADKSGWGKDSNRFHHGTISPNDFHLFQDWLLQAQGVAPIQTPESFQQSIKSVLSEHHELAIRHQMDVLQSELDTKYSQFGKMAFETAHSNAGLQAAMSEYDTLQTLKLQADQVDLKLNQLLQYQNAWQQHAQKIQAADKEKQTFTKSLIKYTEELGAAYFKHEKAAIQKDPTLAKAFNTLLHMDLMIQDRIAQIKKMEADKSSWLSAIKNKAQILYLQGLNTKDLWSMNKHWPSVGKVVLQHVQHIAPESAVFPVWQKIQGLKSQENQLKSQIHTAQVAQQGIQRQVEQLNPSVDLNDKYPWGSLLKAWNKQLQELRAKQSEIFAQTGQFFSTNAAYQEVIDKDLAIQIQQLITQHSSLEQQLPGLPPLN